MSYCVTGVFLVYLVHPPCLKFIVGTESFPLLSSLLDKGLEELVADILRCAYEARSMQTSPCVIFGLPAIDAIVLYDYDVRIEPLDVVTDFYGS